MRADKSKDWRRASHSWRSSGAAAGIRTRVVGLEGQWTQNRNVLDQARLRPHKRTNMVLLQISVSRIEPAYILVENENVFDQ